MQQDLVVVAGGGGFIGGNLAAALCKNRDIRVRCVDIKPLEKWQIRCDEAENVIVDLNDLDACQQVCSKAVAVYHLAADMGGAGFLDSNKARTMLSVVTDANLLVAARDQGCQRFFFASTACVYSTEHQKNASLGGLAEKDAYPALPEDGYGWQKLFGEQLCRHFTQDFGLETRVARFHNVYGPHCPWRGGRESVPAAMCRKAIEAKHRGDNSIEIWGDGSQVRGFMYIDDCVEGIQRIMNCDRSEPINLGSDIPVSINELVDELEALTQSKFDRQYRTDAPQGVSRRYSDNTLIRNELGWAPETPLAEGLPKTYAWIEEQIQLEHSSS